MTNSQEKRVTRTAESKGFRLEKAGKGLQHGRFSIVSKTEGSRMPSGITDFEFTFSLQEAEYWLARR